MAVHFNHEAVRKIDLVMEYVAEARALIAKQKINPKNAVRFGGTTFLYDAKGAGVR